MRNELKQYIKSKTLCEVFKNIDDPNSFGVGYFLACDEDYFVVWYVDSYGFYNGMSCLPIDYIYSIQTDTAYLHDMQLLMKHNKVSLNVELDYHDNVLVNFLKQIMSEQKMCGIEVLENEYEDVFGRIDEVDEDNGLVKLSLVTVNGQENGKAIIDIETISEIYYQSKYITKLEVLNKLKNKK